MTNHYNYPGQAYYNHLGTGIVVDGYLREEPQFFLDSILSPGGVPFPGLCVLPQIPLGGFNTIWPETEAQTHGIHNFWGLAPSQPSVRFIQPTNASPWLEQQLRQLQYARPDHEQQIPLFQVITTDIGENFTSAVPNAPNKPLLEWNQDHEVPPNEVQAHGHDRPQTVLESVDDVDCMPDNHSKTSKNPRNSKRWKKKVAARVKTKALILDQPTTERVFQDDTGKPQGEMKTFGGSQRTRAAFDEERRALTAKTRKDGACMECRFRKKRCPPRENKNDPCITCITISAKRGVPRMPCCTVKITEVDLFRLRPPKDGPLNTWALRNKLCRLKDSSDSSILIPERMLELTQDMGKVLKISVSEFTPAPGDKTGYSWTDGNGHPRTMEMPHYYVTDTEEVGRSVIEYVEESTHLYLESLLDSSNDILCDTFNLAMRDYGSKTMVRKALKLWAASRVIEETWRICGEDTLGLKPDNDRTNPWHGIIPVTPIMDTQLDQIVITRVLIPLRAELLEELEKKVYERKRENWFEIYLTIFILLSNTERILAHGRRFAKRYGLKGRYGYFGRKSPHEAFFHAAKILLAHFHLISRGYIPWASPKAAKYAKLHLDQAEYMAKVKKQIESKEVDMNRLREKREYEANLYWCSQLFFEGWMPVEEYIEEEVIDS